MTNVDTVSIENNKTLTDNGVVSKTQDAILSALAAGAATTGYIAAVTGIKLLTVRPAMTALVKRGRVVKTGRVKNNGISENLFALAA